MTAAGAFVAPLAWAAGRVLTHPILPNAIAAPRRVMSSSGASHVSYYEDDSASGLPVLLLHDVGPTGSTYELRALFDAIRIDRAVVAPDLPGYGFSEHRARHYGREDYVRFVQDFVADLSRRYGATVDIVAIGTTGELAATAIARASRHVRSLAIIGPTGFGRAHPVTRELRRLVEQPLVGRIVHRVSASRAVLRMALARRLSERVDEGLVSYANAAANQARAAAAINAALSGALSDPRIVEDVYDTIRVPTCLVHGSEADVPRDAIDAFVAGHGAFRRVEVPGTRAMPHVDRALATADALRAFWSSLGVKPELRVIRGERRTAPRPWRGPARARPSGRRRTWT